MATAAQYPNRMDPKQSVRAAQPRTGVDALGMTFKERTEPKFIKLEEGEYFAGILVRIERTKIDGKPATCYYALDVETDENVKFNGVYDLDTKFRPSDIGHAFKMRCEGSREVGRGQKMKVFKVEVSEQTAPGWASDGTPITENDIGL